MEAVQRKVGQAVHDMMVQLDKSHLRRIQGDVHRCAAKCCDNTSLSMEEEQQCVDDCSKKLVSFQTAVEQEMKEFQVHNKLDQKFDIFWNRLERCAMSCQDEIRDKTGSSNPTQEEVDLYKPRMMDCVTECAEQHILLLPQLTKRLEATLKK